MERLKSHDVEVLGSPKWFTDPKSFCSDARRHLHSGDTIDTLYTKTPCAALDKRAWLQYLLESWNALRDERNMTKRLSSDQCRNYFSGCFPLSPQGHGRWEGSCVQGT